MGMCSSNLQKVNAMKEITRIKVKEVDVGLKRKTHAPLEEVLENVEVGKSKKNLMIVGDGMSSTIITGSLNFVDGTTTFNSATVGKDPYSFLSQDLKFITSLL